MVTEMAYIGRCRGCGNVVGAWLALDYDRTEEVMDMLKRGLVVELSKNDPPVKLQGCTHESFNQVGVS